MTPELHRFPFPAMGSPCEVQLYSEDAAEAKRLAGAAMDEVERIEAKYSRYREDSLLSRINDAAGDAGGVHVDPETAALLDYAATSFRESDGLFDITSGVLREVWDFRSGRLPERTAVREVLERVGFQKLRWDRPHLTMPSGMQLDFGGYGKEYAADRAADAARAAGATSGLIDLGGDVSVIGPHPTGEPWLVGIRAPRADGEAIASLELDRGGIATSGDYQRCMWVDGKRYAHILDPRTGWPVAGLASVSVVASHCLIAGTASTIAMLKGEGGSAWLDTSGMPHLRIDADGVVGGSLVPG